MVDDYLFPLGAARRLCVIDERNLVDFDALVLLVYRQRKKLSAFLDCDQIHGVVVSWVPGIDTGNTLLCHAIVDAVTYQIRQRGLQPAFWRRSTNLFMPCLISLENEGNQ